MLRWGATSDRSFDGSILATEMAIAINPQKDFAAKRQGDRVNSPALFSPQASCQNSRCLR
ncbi:hypothetical protein NG796_05550 [Laspinema sp. A4]|uniref:hypothetical protein n=1 Tax=Laspinema sp. D2d TaxID=2953686 RepID=UPI0021BA815A|nr:hypothetical protein [Laspinema sp. D2d]MCT7982756.1 hypothetical protein [Laspinema sp. D2d]